MKEKEGIRVYHLSDEAHPNRFFRLEKMEDHYDDTNGTADDPHRHDFYAVIWINKGKGSHLIDFNTYDLADDQVFFLSPGQIHQITTRNRPNGWVLSFSADFLALNNIPLSFINNINLFQPYSETPPLHISQVLSYKLEQIINDMIPFFEQQERYYNEALGALLQLFLIQCNTECDLPQPLESKQSCILVDFRNAVEKSFKHEHKVGGYADMLNVSSKYLNEVIKDSLGYTAKEYILERIIIEAKRLLLHTELNVKQIGYELGFKEPIHFSAFFKKTTGSTPLDFKSAGK